MRIQSIVSLALVLAGCAFAAAEAGRRSRNCGNWTYTDCVPVSGACGRGTQNGRRDGENCKVKERQRKCMVPCTQGGREGPADLAARTHGSDGRRRGQRVPCRYERVPWGDCDATTGVKTRTLTLKAGDETCERTKTETKECKAAAAPCKYQRGEWSDCDTTTNQRTRTLTLKKGDATTCQATKSETKECRANAGCKYGRDANWTPGACVDGAMKVTLVLKKGDPQVCAATLEKNKRCRNRLRRAASSSGRCRYTRGEWSECDETTNTRTRVNRLRRDNPRCQETQTETKKCKKACRYQKGEWSECNSEGSQQRTDSLKAGSDATTCEATRSTTRRCKNRPKCKYNFGTWSDCEGDRRTRTKTLISGDAACDKTRIVVRSCNGRTRTGNRCQFSAWGEFGDCVNGVRTKTRTVTSGGEKCQRKAVRTKPCNA